jgi:peptide-methionine (S)-S-oxide reductase
MKISVLFYSLLTWLGCDDNKIASNEIVLKEPISMPLNDTTEVAVFAGGCFWCTEAVYLEIKGIQKVVSGYIGGKVENPTYEQICTGTTGHAEAVQITYNPKEVTYEELLEIFFATHDPTTLNRQGNDIGTQYRSEIFYYNEAQKIAAQSYIEQLNLANVFRQPIVTKVSPASIFYVAEDYHQNYYAYNKTQSYCHYVITPKVEKVRKKFTNKLKQK